MKKALLLGAVLCISLGVTACTQSDKEQSKEEPKVKQEEVEGTPLTDEEMKEINENVENALRENVAYKFGKVLSVEGTTIEVSIIDTPKGYDDKGYNNNLDIDTSKLKETGESISIDLIGIDTNMIPEEINEVKYVRIGTYESEDENDNTIFKQGQVTSLYKID